MCRVPYHHGNLRTALTEAAVELARAGGPEAVVLRQVARRAGVTSTAAYRHFADHEDLLEHVTHHAMATMHERIRAAAAGIPPGERPIPHALARLRAAAGAYVAFARAEPGLFATAFRRARGTGEAGPGSGAGSIRANCVGTMPGTVLGTFLDDLVRAGQLPAAARQNTEHAVWAAVHGLSTLLLDGPLRHLGPSAQEAAIDSILGLVAPDDRQQPAQPWRRLPPPPSRPWGERLAGSVPSARGDTMESATATGETPETDEIAEKFDESSDMSDVFNDGQVHLSYWYDDEDQAPLIEASQRLTRKVADALRLRKGDRVLDVGCGLGAPAIQLATEYGVQVTGVNISTRQVADAHARVQAAGLTDQVSFRAADFSALDYPDGSFDAVVAMESLVYVDDLGQTLDGLRRVLRPGGRLSLAEPVREGLGVVAAGQFAARFGAKWLLSVAEWLDPLRAAGFEPVEHLQCGPRVFGMGPKYLHAVDTRRDELAARFGEAAVDELRQTLEDFFSPGAEQIGYAVITVRRPRN